MYIEPKIQIFVTKLMININTSQNALKRMLINPAYHQIIAVFWNHFSIFQKAFILHTNSKKKKIFFFFFYFWHYKYKGKKKQEINLFPHKQTLQWKDFHNIIQLIFLRKKVHIIQFPLEICIQNNENNNINWSLRWKKSPKHLIHLLIFIPHLYVTIHNSQNRSVTSRLFCIPIRSP